MMLYPSSASPPILIEYASAYSRAEHGRKAAFPIHASAHCHAQRIMWQACPAT